MILNIFIYEVLRHSFKCRVMKWFKGLKGVTQYIEGQNHISVGNTC